MKLNPYLDFNGNCAAAFRFYEQCLGGKIVAMIPHAGSPIADQTPPEWQDAIMHARLVIGDNVLMGSDSPPNIYQKPHGTCVSLMFDEIAEAERVYHALSENGDVHMPIQETFWAHRFALFADQFGIPWIVNCEKQM